NVASSGFVERQTERETAGNQDWKLCGTYSASETDCRRAGCSWLSAFDQGNLQMGGYYASSLATAPNTPVSMCSACANQPTEVLKLYFALGQTPCVNAEDVCACMAGIPGICSNPAILSWWPCPHVCPQHSTSCANVARTGFEEIA
ncbi:unnamed protein product, partial [Amoebophrya sp. A25]